MSLDDPGQVRIIRWKRVVVVCVSVAPVVVMTSLLFMLLRHGMDGLPVEQHVRLGWLFRGYCGALAISATSAATSVFGLVKSPSPGFRRFTFIGTLAAVGCLIVVSLLEFGWYVLEHD